MSQDWYSRRGAQVYVSASKRTVLNTLGLPPEYEALLTTDDRARLHAVPLWRVSLKHMARTLKHYRGRYTTIVGFQPTGWSMHSGACFHQSSIAPVVISEPIGIQDQDALPAGDQTFPRNRIIGSFGML
jgi:hypothetical protein